MIKAMATKYLDSQVQGELYPRHFLGKEAQKHFVELTGFFVTPKKFFICMECLPNDLVGLESLYFEAKGKLLGEVVIGNLIRQILFGLFYLHQRHFVHRDIKP